MLSDIAESKNTSVLQRWVMELPLRMQGVLMSAARGCDITEKPRTPGEGPIERHLSAYLRWTFMVPADPREVLIKGAFMRIDAPVLGTWKPSEMGHLPVHYYAHLMHAFQVVSVCHPNATIRTEAGNIYNAMVYNLHLCPEGQNTFYTRLTEDRVANGTVVS